MVFYDTIDEIYRLTWGCHKSATTDQPIQPKRQPVSIASPYSKVTNVQAQQSSSADPSPLSLAPISCSLTHLAFR